MGRQLGRIPSIPGYLVFQTLCLWGGMYGGTTREDPEYPGILSIPDTVSVRGMYWGTTREDPEYAGILSILDTVCSAPKIGLDSSAHNKEKNLF